jgi:general secretion pathway protein K
MTSRSRARFPSRPGAQRGIALVVVLWLVVLLTVMAASHARNIRIEAYLAYNQVEAAKARSLAEAGVNRAIMELFAADGPERWSFDGTLTRVGLDTGTVDISIRDATGLLDLNAGAPALLEALLAGAGVEEDRRQDLVDAILDWRDKDDLKHLHGAEDADYRRAGLEWEARDDRFTTVDELRYVLGMTNELFERLAPYLTVYSGRGEVNADYAPPWLLTVLTTVEEDSVGGNTGAAAPGLVGRARTDPAAGTGARGGSGTYHIRVRATSGGGSVASLEAVIRIATAGEPSYVVLAWREPAPRIRAMPG